MSDHLKYPKEAGIYKLTCVYNNKIYIGKAVNINKRLGEHKNCKRVGYLQNAISKHGWDSFTVEILEIFDNFDKLKDNDTLLEREAYYIGVYDSTDVDKGYNLCKFSRDKTGLPHSEETKGRMRLKALGRTPTEETKEKLRLANIGKKLSEETKEKMRVRMIGNTYAIGTIHSDETKEKIKSARNPESSKRTVEKMRQANLGKTRSEETKEKIRQSKLGKKFTEEHKENLRKSHLKKDN